MPLFSRVTKRSLLEHSILESILRTIPVMKVPSTNVDDGLPRKRGAVRVRVKKLQCQSAPGKPNNGIRITRACPSTTIGRISTVDATVLRISLKRSTASQTKLLPSGCTAMQRVSFLVDRGKKWAVESHTMAFYACQPSGIAVLPPAPPDVDNQGDLIYVSRVRCDVLCRSLSDAFSKVIDVERPLHAYPSLRILDCKRTLFRLLRCEVRDYQSNILFIGGGERKVVIPGSVVSHYLADSKAVDTSSTYILTDHFGNMRPDELNVGDDQILTKIPLLELVDNMTLKDLMSAGLRHDVVFERNETVPVLIEKIKAHSRLGRSCCSDQVSIVRRKVTTKSSVATRTSVGTPEKPHFPPKPLTERRKEDIIKAFTSEFCPDNVLEAGCTICGQLTLCKDLEDVDDDSFEWSLLYDETGLVTKAERRRETDIDECLEGPVVDSTCDRRACKTCLSFLRAKTPKRPPHSLANGLWIGNIPKELRDLTFAERLLISRVRFNYCVVKVTSSMHYKMRANAIMFPSPVAKIYDILPPKREDLDEVLAYLFIGPQKPTQQDHERAPMLVRRNKVWDALTWLKLNHYGYRDLLLSRENLETYKDGEPPVIVNYRQSSGEREPESSGVYEEPENEGTEEGPCPFAVHTVEASDISIDTDDAQLKHLALLHLKANERNTSLGIGRGNTPESLYNNPMLYPNAFPWLFPYGVGGLEIRVNNKNISDTVRKRQLLMYHDKRFQLDPYFHLVAFNHEQIKQGAKGGFLTAKKTNFPDIAKRVLNLDVAVLTSLYSRMESGEHVIPKTDAEKLCFQVIHDLDHVGQHVSNSKTSRKGMKNELWSTICSKGAPSWFITFAPSDTHHPLALYMAGSSDCVYPKIYDTKQMDRMIARNPVACARFFHFMVKAFIKHILGFDSTSPGLFGDCKGYYGTVEEQGRLRLHLHLVLWIKGAFTPQEIRDKLEDKNGAFQRELIAYLESCHTGTYLTSDTSSIAENSAAPRDDGFRDATYALPSGPPDRCDAKCLECDRCNEYEMWRHDMERETDELLWRVNRHNHHAGCTSIKYPKCKSRFPRKVVEKTTVDPETGHLEIRHGEPDLNTFNPILTYVMRCNSDVTSLLSGTALKAVIAYVTDYITKNPLRTHTMFDVIRGVFRRNDEFLNGDATQEEKAQKLLVQITNSLTVKQEVGAPMASAFLLGHPDHYTNFTYKHFYWRSYVAEVKSAWKATDVAESGERVKADEPTVILTKTKDGSISSYTATQDYMFRPKKYENTTLYEWIERYVKKPIPKKKSNNRESDNEYEEDVSCSDVDSDAELEKDLQSDDDYSPVRDEETRFRSTARSSHDVFLVGHPQRKTHAVSMLSEEKSRIPIFSGGLLPRPDEGNTEDYYITMLTLYKPWRTGRELKTEHVSWKDAHDSYEYPERFVEIRKCCNIRYECWDARDDYRQSRKSDSDSGLFFMHGQFAAEAEGRMKDDERSEGDEPNDFMFDLSAPATDSAHKADEMKREMEHALLASNWQRVSLHPRLEPSRDIVKGEETSSKGWSQLLETAKDKEIDERNVRMQGIDVNAPETPTTYMDVDAVDGVEVMDRAYFCDYCKDATLEDKARMDETITKFSLNKEQERAFRLVANHSLLKVKEPLAMHLGGMGGTGKSRVINSLIDFFKLMGKGHIFLIVAPTGTAASLVGGQTYHSVLAFNNGGEDGKSGRVNTSAKALKSVRERIKLVEYVFMDEISMLNCEGLCNISSQMCNAMNALTTPFAGKSMIWAGDFAQLPPIDGKRLFNIDVDSTVHTTNALKSQKSNIGRALWHQVTDVVLLKQNMRQNTQSQEDSQYRTVLENLRYNACTDDDVQVLKRRVASRFNPSVDLQSDEFRHASMITGRNHCRDRVNNIGCRAFASDTGQELHSFYSIDALRSVTTSRNEKGRRKGQKGISGDASRIPDKIQDAIWDVDPTHTKHHAGVLRLCIDMPVLVKHNVATELCITNGAEGKIAGWKARDIGRGRKALETVFVELIDPKKEIQLGNLPLNVVPISPQKQSILVNMPNGKPIPVTREQVPVHPNFAMTDYCSQGRTRIANVVDLKHCKSYHSVYTALSRSSTYSGTVIIRMPEMKYLRGTLPRGLRQEFRELEMLNEITRLRFEGKLDKNVRGGTREQLIKSYQKCYKNPASASDVHNSIAWAKGETLKPTEDNAKWKYEATKANTEINDVPEVQSKAEPGPNSTKRKADSDGSPSLPISTPRKRRVVTVDESSATKSRTRTSTSRTLVQHYGPSWNRNSCAFDSVLFVIYNILRDASFNDKLAMMNFNKLWPPIIDQCSEAFRTSDWSLLNVGRENLRSTLMADFPESFNFQGNRVGDVCSALFTLTRETPHVDLVCVRCGATRSKRGPHVALWTITPDDPCKTVIESLKYIITARKKCRECEGAVTYSSGYLPESVPVFCVQTDGIRRECSATTTLYGVRYALRGIVYGGNFHFTSRFITRDQIVYSYDGMHQQAAVREGHFRDVKSSLWALNDRIAIMYIYFKTG